MRHSRQGPLQRAERREAFPAVEPSAMICIHHQFESSRPCQLVVEKLIASNDIALTWEIPNPAIINTEARGRDASARGNQNGAGGHAPRTRTTGQQVQR